MIGMNEIKSSIRENLLNIIKQCTSYKFVDENVNINELQVVDADFFIDHLHI